MPTRRTLPTRYADTGQQRSFSSDRSTAIVQQRHRKDLRLGFSQRRAVARAMRGWLDGGREAVLATVVTTTDSAPRGVGAQLVITDGDLWVGGLSGGCAEVAVLVEARRLLDAGNHDGVRRSATQITMTRDTPGSVGPVCGATLGVLIERVDEGLASAMEAVAADSRGQLVRLQRSYDRLSNGDLLRSDVATVETLAGDGTDTPPRREQLEWTVQGTRTSLRELVPLPPRLVVGGAGDIACELVQLAQQLGWRTVLVDPRVTFIEQTLAQVQPDEVIRQWPPGALTQSGLDATTACLAAAHDERIDLPFLTTALASDAFYVGSVGSRVVQHERARELEQAVGAELAARHHGPAGLNLGGSDAAEIALSVLAEAVATWNGRTGSSLRQTSEPIRAR